MDIVDVFPEDPFEPTVKYAGAIQTPFTVPWAEGRIKLCAGFNTQRAQNDTLFMPRSAFQDIRSTPLQYRECQSTAIRDESRSDIATQSETSTFAISASIGGSFLGASGRGSYEKSVRDNANVGVIVSCHKISGQLIILGRHQTSAFALSIHAARLMSSPCPN